MSARRFFVLIFIWAWSSGPAALLADESPIADGKVFGHFIDDEGVVVFGVNHEGHRYRPSLVRWTATGTKSLEVRYEGDFALRFKSIQAAPSGGNELRLSGVMVVDDSSHGAWARQAYELTGNHKLRQLWSVDTSQWVQSETPIEVSPDGAMWGVVAEHKKEDDPYRTLGLHFAFGSTSSMKPRRSETLVFHEERSLVEELHFLFLSSDGPVVLAPYGDDYYLIRFTDFGADSQRVDQLRPVRKAFGSSWPLVFWQPGDRVLWTTDGKEWMAWDLWDLGVAGFPGEPFLRLEMAFGEPHPVRGFVRETVTERGYRIEHLWQSPRIEHLNERHVSDWRSGVPVSVSVSPNGRYAVAQENVTEQKDDEPEQWELRQMLSRFELTPALPPPPPRPTDSEEVH